ncbi:sensor histidine kinase, partial [Pseudonocardia acidicola]
MAFESATVLLGAALVASFSGTLSTVLGVDDTSARYLLALLSAGVGAAAVGLGETAGRLSGNRRAAWLIPALALYSVAVLPGTAPAPDDNGAAEPPHPGLVVTYLTLVILLLAAIRPPGRSGTRAGWIVAVAGGLLAVVLRELGGVLPVSGPLFGSPVPVNLVALLGWCLVSTAVVAAGCRLRSAPLWRLGLGFGVIAAAHVYRASELDGADAGVVFSMLRLLGMVVVLLGMAQLLRRALRTVLAERFAHEEELRLAAVHAERVARRAAEREHELRNGLSGLSGMARLLDGDPGDEGRRRARSAVRTELRRLSDLLERKGHAPPGGVYDAGRTLDELVALWRLAGLDVEASVEPGLLATGRQSDFSQAITNLLTNCSRHAPGARVWVIARRTGAVLTVQVRDDGPGLVAQAPPAPGDPERPHGMGLQIVERLVAGEGGRLRLHPPDPARPGCTVSVELPAA